MLTEMQAKVLKFVQAYSAAQGRSPTVRELCDGVGVRSTNAVAEQVERLRRRGFLAPAPRGVTRAIQLSEAGRMAIGAPCCTCVTCRCSCHRDRRPAQPA